jgi:hypothetical protein
MGDQCRYDDKYEHEEVDWERIRWSSLAPEFVSTYLLTEYPEKINWRNIHSDTYTDRILESSFDKISGYFLSDDEAACYVRRIYWAMLLRYDQNPVQVQWFIFFVHRDVIDKAKRDPEKRNWTYLSTEVGVGHRLRHSLDTHELVYFLHGPDVLVFQKREINYLRLRKKMDIICKELMEESMHPKRLIRHLEMGGYADDF